MFLELNHAQNTPKTLAPLAPPHQLEPLLLVSQRTAATRDEDSHVFGVERPLLLGLPPLQL